MRILIVDDQPLNRQVLFSILEDDHEILEAENGIEACALYKSDRDIDLVLMDVNMPEMNGLRAAREMKDLDPERFVPIIFVTALDDVEMLAKCLEAGGDDFVPKPVNEGILLAKINAHRRSRRLYNNLKAAHSELEYHRQQVGREHAIVEHVFAKRMARVKTECCNIERYTSPVSMFDGDLVLISPAPSGGVYVLIGDFTGHGLASSIGSLPVSEIFFSLAERQASISQIVVEINTRLFELLPRNMFFCATLLYMDVEGKTICVWSGGMNDMLLHEPDSQRINTLAGTHMPLGILQPEEFDDSPVLLEVPEGTDLYLFTDGVNEAQNIDGEMFGFERLHRIILQNYTDPIKHITDSVHSFCVGREQSDDISIIKLRVAPVQHRSKATKEIIDVSTHMHNASSFPWTFKMHLQNEELKNTSIVNQIMNFVSSIQGIELHRDKIFTIVSELYSNALEHGVLGLESALKSTPEGFDEYYRLRSTRLEQLEGQYIDLEFSWLRGEPNKICLLITDSGKGFDIVAVTRDISENANAHGRGLVLLNCLCSELEYSNGGRTVKAVYELRRHL